MKISWDELEGSNLVIDCIYEGGENNYSGEPFKRLFPKLGTNGGVRYVLREDGSEKVGYVILFSTKKELEWPDFLDRETGILRYYGDNREPGRSLSDTLGNQLFEKVFEILNVHESMEDIPPFFVFERVGIKKKRDIKFLGVAAPGNPNISPDKDLIALWRTINGERFQNYEAYFTILDTGTAPITREWIDSLIDPNKNQLDYAPEAWKEFISKGREGIVPLESPKQLEIPTIPEQYPDDKEGKKCIKKIYNHYRKNAFGFEAFAVDMVLKLDNNFTDFNLTRPWRDRGRDAIGKYKIKSGAMLNDFVMECSLEAKCFKPGGRGVGVKEMSRLISRIKHSQFGIMVTTSHIGKQAYEEVKEDGHPILIITAKDIAEILRLNSINSDNLDELLDTIDSNDIRFL